MQVDQAWPCFSVVEKQQWNYACTVESLDTLPRAVLPRPNFHPVQEMPNLSPDGAG